MIFADLPLARRLERAAMAIESAYARTHAARRPGADIEVLPVADGCALFAGVGSPMTQATGLGLDGPVAEMDLDALESVYFRRGTGARIVVCPMADGTFVRALNRRGYGITEFESTLIRELRDEEPGAGPANISIRPATIEEADLFADVVGPNFTDDGVLTPALREMMVVIFSVPAARAFFALVDGRPAGGGSLLIHEGVAMLAGAATLPAYRNRGVQTALLHARLAAARRLGCDLAVMGATPGSGSQRNAERRGFRVAYTKVVLTREPMPAVADPTAGTPDR